MYSIAGGKTSVCSSEITGPRGIGLNADEKTLYVSHNISAGWFDYDNDGYLDLLVVNYVRF